MLGLLEDGELWPGAARIAARAGVSERSVFRHFDDLEALAAVAIDRRWARVGPLFEPPDSGGSRAERVASLAEQRLRLHERVMPVARAGLIMAATSPTVALAVVERRALLHRQVAGQFAVELGAVEGRARAELLAVLDAAASLDAVEYLRSVSGLSRAATRRALSRTLEALLATVPAASEHR